MLATLLVMLALVGCGTARRTAIEGYPESALTGKRVMILMPDASAAELSDPAAYAYSRGITEDNAREQVENEMRTLLVPALNARLDSNTVFYYRDQPVSGQVPLDATKDFTTMEPRSWSTIKSAAREGNIDYLVVVNRYRINNRRMGSQTRGEEGIQADILLLDAQGARVMTTARIESDLDDLNSPSESMARFVEQLTGKLPFAVREQPRP